MKRSLMQIYVKDSKDAASHYQKAFDANLSNVYLHDDGSYVHAELNIHGQILALSEANHKNNSGNVMQFCLQFEKNEIDFVKKAYEVLKEEAQIENPIGEVFYSLCMFSLIDRFGVNWCLFI